MKKPNPARPACFADRSTISPFLRLLYPAASSLSTVISQIVPGIFCSIQPLPLSAMSSWAKRRISEVSLRRGHNDASQALLRISRPLRRRRIRSRNRIWIRISRRQIRIARAWRFRRWRRGHRLFRCWPRIA